MKKIVTHSKNGAAPKITSILLLLAIIVTFFGCGGGSSALVGKWQHAGGHTGLDLELLKDGTAIADRGTAATWRAEGGRFFLTLHGQTMPFNYKVSGATLTLTDDNGRSEEYKKVTPKVAAAPHR